MLKYVIKEIVSGRLMLVKSVNGEAELLILQSGSFIEGINGLKQGVMSLPIFLFLFVQGLSSLKIDKE